MHTRRSYVIVLLCSVSAFACSGQKEAPPAGAPESTAVPPAAASTPKDAAQAALTAAKAAFAALKPEADKLAAQPTVRMQSASVDIMLEAAQRSFDQGDYPFALDQIKLANGHIAELGPAIAAAKADPVGAEWASVKASVQTAIAAVENRATALAKSTTLPAGVTKAIVKAAQDGVAAAKIEWAKAVADGDAGKREAATKQARQIQERLGTLLLQLK